MQPTASNVIHNSLGQKVETTIPLLWSAEYSPPPLKAVDYYMQLEKKDGEEMKVAYRFH